MKIKVLKELMIGRRIINSNEIIDLDDINDYIKDLNEEFYLLIYHGLRYDVLKEHIKILK